MTAPTSIVLSASQDTENRLHLFATNESDESRYLGTVGSWGLEAVVKCIESLSYFKRSKQMKTITVDSLLDRRET